MAQCKICVVDDSDPNLNLDENGFCQYCRQWIEHPEQLGCIPNAREAWLNDVLPKIKETGKNSRYDCIIGASGGVDSSFVALTAKRDGLRPLLVHVVGGFDTDICQRNLKRVVDYTGFDVEYWGVDPEEYRSVQLAYLEASVMDSDVPADYLIEAFIRKVAQEHNVKYVLSGGNYYADAFMPSSWTFVNKQDWTNLRNINEYFNYCEWYKPLNSFPVFGALQVIWSKHIYGLKYTTPLNYLGDYNRDNAMNILGEELGFECYGDKHWENIFTRFYQLYIAPLKFNIDKRKMNYSNFIRAGGWTREQALEELARERYPEDMLKHDWEFIKQKLRVTDCDLERWMTADPVPHERYGTDKWIYDIFETPYVKTRHWVGNILRSLGLI